MERTVWGRVPFCAIMFGECNKNCPVPKLLNAALYVKYAAVDVHTRYFDTTNKAANILNEFWNRAVK